MGAQNDPSEYLENIGNEMSDNKVNFIEAISKKMTKNDIKSNIAERCLDYANSSMEQAYQNRHPDYKESKSISNMKGGLYLLDNKIGVPVGHAIYGAGLATRENFDIHYNTNPLGLTDNFEKSWDAFKRATDLGL